MESIVRRISSSKKLVAFMKGCTYAIEGIVSLSFCLQLLLTALDGQIVTAVKVAVSAAVGLVMVSVLRKVINAPRPYEIYDFFDTPPRHGKGCSFPSRHAYSSFVIAVLAWLFHPVLAVCLAALAVCLCVFRVLLGVHFLRDVLCGAAIGVIAGVIGILIVII